MKKQPLLSRALRELAVASKISIRLVTDDRQMTLGTLYTELMASSRAWLQLDERERALAHSARPNDGHTTFGRNSAGISRCTNVAAFFLHSHQVAPKLHRFRRLPKDERLINLGDLLSLELRADFTRQRFIRHH